jgi:hypothetical protein
VSKLHRRRILIDRPIQQAVMLRTMLYWGLGTIAQVLMVLYFALITTTQRDFINFGPQLWWQLQISLLASAVLLPIILLDVLRLSHRWVGPIFRLRASLKAMARGEAVEPVRFRDGDFWQDLAVDLNAVSAEFERHKADGNPGTLGQEKSVEVADSQRASQNTPPVAAIAP